MNNMRAFIGIRIPSNEKIIEILDLLKKEKGIKAVEPENLHINLKFLGEISKSQYDEVTKILKTIKERPFKVKVTGVGFFPSKSFIRVIFLKAEANELNKLQKQLEEKLEKIGFLKEKREFIPHITLARCKKKPDEKLVNKILELAESLKLEVKVNKIELIKSTLNKAGPTYETLFEVEL